MKNKIQAFLVIGALSVLNITAQETEEIVSDETKVSDWYALDAVTSHDLVLFSLPCSSP